MFHMELFTGLIDSKTLKIIGLFINNPDEFYHINKVSDETDVPLATTFRIINILTKNEILEYKLISKFKIYRLAKNTKTNKLRKII